jgi:outer membrane lipoprotein-sorting protein
VAKDDITQAYVYFIGQGVKRDTPDYYALNVMNEIFSGGFSGRLMNDIRTARGLAYNVGGGIGTDWDHPGLFRVSAGTKSGTAIEALNAIRTEISDLTTKPFTAAEIEDAKQTLLNAFIFTRDAKSKILGQRIDLEFYGYPADWYDRYVSGIEKVTAADVERVAKKYIAPSQLAVLVVGNEKDYDKPLSSLGAVTPIDITIPEANVAPKPAADGSKPPATPAARDTNAGLALAKKVQDFVGGKAKIDAVQAVHSAGTMKTKTPGGEIEMEIDTLVRYPDTRRTVMKMPMGEVTMVSTPEGAFVNTPMGVQDLPSSQRDAQKAEARFDMLNVLKNVDKPGYTFAVTGTEKVDNVDAAVLEITTDGSTVKWWIDPATGRPLRRTSKSRQGETLTTVGDWKTFGGLQFFTTFASTANGEQIASGTLTTVEVNPVVDPKLFEKPAK